MRVLDGGIEIARVAYDGIGRRVQKTTRGTTRRYVYEGMDILEELPGKIVERGCVVTAQARR